MNFADFDLPATQNRLTDLVSKRRDYRQEIRNLVSHYPKVVFYGCGNILNSIPESWDAHIGRKIDHCCDSDPGKWGKTFCGATCLSPEELFAIKDECTVFVTVGNYTEVFEQLKAKGFPSVNLLYKYDLSAAEYLEQIPAEEVASNLTKAFACLGDERSRNVFNAIVSRVLDGSTPGYPMLDVFEPDQYFPESLPAIDPEEVFVDIGGFDGDTVRALVQRTQGCFRKIISFELNSVNYSALAQNVSAMQERDRIQIFNLGIWDSAGEITYSVEASQSTIGAGQCVGHVKPLDEVLPEEPVTYIKMDIEGAEPQALAGARRIIQARKPRMAVCIYHDFRHLWEVPLYLKSLVPEYRIYLRHHTKLEYETVCYAIPS